MKVREVITKVITRVKCNWETSDKECGEIVSLGSENQAATDKICALLVAVSPILQHYIGFYKNAGFSVLIIAFFLLSLRSVPDIKNGIDLSSLKPILPLLLFEAYTVLDRSFQISRVMYVLFFIWVFICISIGALNVKYFFKYATAIVSIAAFLLVVQYISHYIFDCTINMRAFSLIVDQNSIWIKHSLMKNRASRMYRPSAFFIEPSHLFLYSFSILCMLLLSPGMTKWRMKKAIIVTLALLMSTSGMGIFVAIGLWGLYFTAFRGYTGSNRKLSEFFTRKNLQIALVFVLAIVVAYFTIPIFHNSIKRVFFSANGSSAIAGRLERANEYVKEITGSAILFGTPNVAGELDFNLAGLYATYIKWGIVGIALTYWYYLQGLFKLKGAYFWYSAIIVAISFFTAHTHGTFYMMYYVIFLANGYYEKALHERGTV